MSRYTPPKRVTVEGHEDFRHSLLTDGDLDEIDEIDDLLEVDPFIPNPPSRRSDRELARVLAILDNLQTGGIK